MTSTEIKNSSFLEMFYFWKIWMSPILRNFHEKGKNISVRFYPFLKRTIDKLEIRGHLHVPDLWVWLVSVARECGLWVWLVSVACECGSWVWLVSVACKCGLWVWLVSVACECGLWVWLVSVVKFVSAKQKQYSWKHSNQIRTKWDHVCNKYKNGIIYTVVKMNVTVKSKLQNWKVFHGMWDCVKLFVLKVNNL